jgi:hypothetical protein
VRAATCDAQFSRFSRIYRESFFLLDASLLGDTGVGGSGSSGSGSGSDRPRGLRGLRFTVSGSHQTPYTMTLRADGACACTCMDAAVNCRRLGVVCKHVCFLAYRVARLERTSFLGAGGAGGAGGHDAGPAGRFTDAEMRAMEASVTNGAYWAEGLNQRPSPRALSAAEHFASADAAAPRAGPPPDFGTVRRTPCATDECPVCYDVLVHPRKPLAGCPDCGNGVHLECAKKWIAHAPRASCVVCRSSVWGLF